jgi:hypothetical protein
VLKACITIAATATAIAERIGWGRSIRVLRTGGRHADGPQPPHRHRAVFLDTSHHSTITLTGILSSPGNLPNSAQFSAESKPVRVWLG